MAAVILAAPLRTTTTGLRFCGSRLASPSRRRLRVPRRHRPRPAKSLAARKLASGFLTSRPHLHARQVLTQSLGTHQEKAVFVVTIALGCVVAANSSTAAGGTTAAASQLPGSPLGNTLRKIPLLGLALGPAGDVLSGVGNLLTGDFRNAGREFGYAAYYPVNRVVDDLGSTTVGLFGNIYGIGRGVQEIGKAILHGGSGMGKAWTHFSESFVWRYGVYSGPGWGLTHRVFGKAPNGTSVFDNPIEANAIVHDGKYQSSTASVRRAADLDFASGLWNGQPGPVGQAYRIIASPLFYLQGTFGAQTP